MSTDDRMETITDPALIRATDEPDERGDFPCCADRAHKESLGGDSESGTYNRSNRPPAGPCTDERTTPAPSSGAGPDLDALHETICDKFTGMAEVRQAADLLVAEVRRLAGIKAHRDNLAAMIRRLSEFLDGRNLNSWKHGACWAAEDAIKSLTARAESAEAEVVTLRAKVAAVEALHWDVEGKCAHCRDCYHDDYLPWPCPTAAALASSPTPSETGEGEHVAREVFTADGIPFVRCSCSTAKSPTSHRWLSEHVPNGGVAELQAVVKRQAEGAKA